MEKQLTAGSVVGFQSSMRVGFRSRVAFCVSAIALALTGIVGVTDASADLLVDRGLPTSNLNNGAGANRSNVTWTETGTPTNYGIDGDTFTNTSSQTWTINTIRVWAVEPAMTTASLWGGVDGSTIGLAASSGTISFATYALGTVYQGSSGTYYPMQQVDFAVNITLAPGQTYDFFLGGSPADYPAPFVHASNAALSSSPQDGADGLMLLGNVVNGSFVQGSVTTWTSLGNGWDKASDVNVQVMGSVAAVPEPETYAMLLAGLGLLGYVGRRRQQKDAAAA